MSTLHEPRLQIDPRCIKCGKAPSVDTPLLEMQNHLYICNACRQEEERKGKRIAWADGGTLQPLELHLPAHQPAPGNGASNSIFAQLDIGADASADEVEAALADKMRFWMFEPDSEEKELMIERLRSWQEELVNDPEFLEKQRSAAQPAQPKGSALTIGGQQVYTAQEFVAACEGSREGWQDGEHLLRKGELQHWILFQLENRTLAGNVHQMARVSVPDFRLLNEILYRLAPERPLYLYAQESWEPPSQVPQVTTLADLAQLCDRHWDRGERHLYTGMLLLWLEQAQHSSGIREYYQACIKAYEHDRYRRGLGLELLLERVVPKLARPELLVTFDGVANQFVLEAWDRELVHKPITLQIASTTRGFSSLSLEILKPDLTAPNWLLLDGARPEAVPLPTSRTTAYVAPTANRVTVSGRLGTGMPARQAIQLVNLEGLERGKTYRQVLRIAEWREAGQPPVLHEYPLTITTMTYFQGLRGKLWLWGLRGDFPGFVWNFATGAVLAGVVIACMSILAAPLYGLWQDQMQHGAMNVGTALMSCLIGAAEMLRQLNLAFLLLIGLITGGIGAYTGFRRGHTSYTEQQSAGIFKKIGRKLVPLVFVFMLFWGIIHPPVAADSSASPYWIVGGSLLVALCVLLLIHAMTHIRARAERFVRRWYADLVNPPGKE
jgi:hypothetical protein